MGMQAGGLTLGSTRPRYHGGVQDRLRRAGLPIAAIAAGGLYLALLAGTGERILPAVLAFVLFGWVRAELDVLGTIEEGEGRGPLIGRPAFRRRATAVMFMGLGTMLLLGGLLAEHVSVDDAREWIRDLGAWGPILLIAVLAAAMVFSPIPNVPLFIAAGLVWGTPLGTVYSVIGQIIGASSAFWISRALGRRHLARIVGEIPAARIDRLSKHLGTRVVFWLRMIPFISFDLTSYAAGLTAMRYGPFILAAALGSVIPTAVVVHFGEALDGSWGARFLSGGLVLAAILIPTGIWALRNRSTMPRRGEWKRAFEELLAGPRVEPGPDVNNA